jgi:hypothetical protein
LIAIAIAGCSSDGGDQPMPPPAPTTTTPPTPPTGTTMPPPPPPPTCTFAGYVLDLVKTKTTASALPDTTLGETCTPSTSQDDFKSLF